MDGGIPGNELDIREHLAIGDVLACPVFGYGLQSTRSP